MLKECAKLYRAPSVNWFIGEMIECMLNPSRWAEFSGRLQNGAQQLTLKLQAEALSVQSKAVKRERSSSKGGRHARPT